MSSWPPEIERERVGPVRGPRLDTGVSLQGMTSFSFHAEALGYILCLFRGCLPLLLHSRDRDLRQASPSLTHYL